MKTDIALFIILIICWAIGIIALCIFALSNYFKNMHFAKDAKRVSIVFFCFPIILIAIVKTHHSIIFHNYKQAVKEVKALCEKDGGDKIYKTVDNVQGVFQMRYRKLNDYRRPDGSFYYEIRDQYGMENPYSWMQGDIGIEGRVGDSSIFPDAPPRGKQGYWFIEQIATPPMSGYRRSYLAPMENPKDWQIEHSGGNPLYEVKQKNTSKRKSRYGYLTEDITTKDMRDKWIGAGRIKIIDLQSNEVLAERKGYYRASGDLLPADADRWSNSYECEFKNPHLLHFLHSVLKPPQDFPNNEQLVSITQD